jgi:hypothetical protein
VLSFAPHEFVGCPPAPEQELPQISRVFDLVADSLSDVATQWLIHIASSVTVKSNATILSFWRQIEAF